MFKILEALKRSPTFIAAGKRVAIRHLGRHDLKRIRAWFRNPELVSFAFGVEGDPAMLQKIADDYYREIYWWQKNAMAIDTVDGGEYIGFMKYTLREDYEPHAKVGILIGEPAFWQHGYGTEAMRMLLAYLFDHFSLGRIELDTADFNGRAQRSFEKCGFRRLGTFTEVNFQDGCGAQKIWMSIERREFERLRPTFEAEWAPVSASNKI